MRASSSAHKQMGPAISRYVRRLWRKDVFRTAAERVAGGKDLDGKTIKSLLGAVEDRHAAVWRERAIGAWCLGRCRLSAEQREDTVSALRTLLAADSYYYDSERNARAVSRALSVSMMVAAPTAAVLLSYLDGLTTIGFLFDWATAFAMGSVALGAILFPPILVYSRVRDAVELSRCIVEAAAALGILADPLAVGLLAKAHMQGSRHVSKASQAALPACLDAVREEHYGLLPPDATDALCELLDRSDEEQTLQILTALELAGTGAAVERVRRLAERSSVHSIQAKAAAIVPILEERLENETAAARLLRPAKPPGEDGEMLLRPASSATAVPEEQLLRPSKGPYGSGQ